VRLFSEKSWVKERRTETGKRRSRRAEGKENIRGAHEIVRRKHIDSELALLNQRIYASHICVDVLFRSNVLGLWTVSEVGRKEKRTVYAVRVADRLGRGELREVVAHLIPR
jgi:hypothetical protein